MQKHEFYLSTEEQVGWELFRVATATTLSTPCLTLFWLDKYDQLLHKQKLTSTAAKLTGGGGGSSSSLLNWLWTSEQQHQLRLSQKTQMRSSQLLLGCSLLEASARRLLKPLIGVLGWPDVSLERLFFEQVSAMVTLPLTYPIRTLSKLFTLQQLRQSSNTSNPKSKETKVMSVAQLARQQGLSRLYSGYFVEFYRTLLLAPLQFLVRSLVDRSLNLPPAPARSGGGVAAEQQQHMNNGSGLWLRHLVDYCADMAVELALFPLHSMSCAVQIGGGSGSGSDESEGWYWIYLRVYRRDGVLGFWRGFAQLMLAGALCAVVDAGVEYGREWHCAHKLRAIEAVKRNALRLRRGSSETDNEVFDFEDGIGGAGAVKAGLSVTAMVCDICLVQRKTLVFAPCGHCVCENCVARVRQSGRCHMCRAAIDSVGRFYL